MVDTAFAARDFCRDPTQPCTTFPYLLLLLKGCSMGIQVQPEQVHWTKALRIDIP
jgi:hypothetical protein